MYGYYIQLTAAHKKSGHPAENWMTKGYNVTLKNMSEIKSEEISLYSMYGDGIHLTVAHKKEWSFVFKADSKAICLPSEEVACRRLSPLEPTKVLNNVSNAFNFIDHSRRCIH